MVTKAQKSSISSKTQASARGKQGKLQTMEELLASTNYQIPTLKRGQEVSGKVVLVSGQEILVDIGAKSEGIIGGKELAGARDLISKLSVGDTIEASVMYPENEAGQVVLSLAKLSGVKRWSELEEKKKTDEEVEVRAIEANRGGLICDFVGLRGFLPTSQLTVAGGKVEDLVGSTLTVRVIEVDRPTNRLIFSQKRPDRQDLSAQIALLVKVKIGEKYKGVVSAILPFGIFVEIDMKESQRDPSTSLRASKEPKETKVKKVSVSSGSSVTAVTSKLEGLVHISEISWEKVDDPLKLFNVGDEVEVMVIAKDMTAGRLNLSIKQLGEDPFLAASEKYSKDQKVRGKVSRVTPYGIFVNLDENIEGLVHISKVGPNIVYNPGEEIDCEIESVDVSSRKISLVPIVREKPILYR